MPKIRVISPLPKQQANATLSQNNPTDDTYYTILDTTLNARIIGIEMDCTWTVQPTPLTLKVEIDGQTLTCTQSNPVSTTLYGIFISERSTNILQSAAADNASSRAFLMEGRTVKISLKVQGGTVQNIHGQVVYAKW